MGHHEGTPLMPSPGPKHTLPGLTIAAAAKSRVLAPWGGDEAAFQRWLAEQVEARVRLHEEQAAALDKARQDRVRSLQDELGTLPPEPPPPPPLPTTP